MHFLPNLSYLVLKVKNVSPIDFWVEHLTSLFKERNLDNADLGSIEAIRSSFKTIKFTVDYDYLFVLCIFLFLIYLCTSNWSFDMLKIRSLARVVHAAGWLKFLVIFVVMKWSCSIISLIEKIERIIRMFWFQRGAQKLSVPAVNCSSYK